jgi:hypothetical protein
MHPGQKEGDKCYHAKFCISVRDFARVEIVRMRQANAAILL